MNSFKNFVYLTMCLFFLPTQACKKNTMESGTNAAEAIVSSGSSQGTTCLSADDVTKEMAAGTSSHGSLQLKQLYAPQVFVDNIGLLSVYVEYDTLGADASGSTPAGVDMTPTFMVWKACAVNNSSNCTNNGKWTLNYSFSAENITDMPMAVDKVSVKVCVPSPKFLVSADQANAVNSCDANFPCYCGAETNMTYDNSKGVLPSSTVQAQIDAVKQARNKMYSIAQNYVNAATNYVSQCSSQDASSNQSAAKIGLQYAQNISVLSPADIAFDAEQIASQRLAYIQALSSANQGMQLASTTDPNAICTAKNTNTAATTGLGLADSREEANKKFLIAMGLVGVGGLVALGGVALFAMDGHGLGSKPIKGASRSDLKRMLLHENDRMIHYYEKFEKGTELLSYQKEKIYNKMKLKAQKMEKILNKMLAEGHIDTIQYHAIRDNNHWKLIEQFASLEILPETYKNATSEKRNEFFNDKVNDGFNKAYADGQQHSISPDERINQVKENYKISESKFKENGISKKIGTKGKFGVGVMGVGIAVMMAAIGVEASTLGLNANCGAFLTTASTYEGQLLSQQSAIQNAQANLSP